MSAGHGDHGDLWSYIEGVREDLGRAEERIHELEIKQQAAADALTQAVGPILDTLGQIAEAISGDGAPDDSTAKVNRDDLRVFFAGIGGRQLLFPDTAAGQAEQRLRAAAGEPS